MANQIATEEHATIIAAWTKAETPEAESVVRKFENSYEGGGGDTVSIKCVDYGSVYNSTDGDMTDVDKSTASIKTSVKVNYKTNIVELSAKDSQLNLEDFSLQIVKPRISKLATKVSEAIIGACARAASYQMVLAPDQISYKELAKAIAYVEDSRIGDKITGIIGNGVKAAVTTRFTDMFGANSSLGDKLYRNKIFEYGGIAWIPNKNAIRVRNPQAIASAVLAAPIASGMVSELTTGSQEQIRVSYISVTFASSGVLKKYTPFTISGVNAVDAYGEDMNEERCFVVADDVTFASGQTVSVPVSPIWIEKTDAGLKNVSGAGVAGAGVSFPLAASTYSIVNVYADKAAGLASLKPAPLQGGGAETAASNVDSINVLMSAQANVTKFDSVHRWDVLVGAEPIYQQGACNIYVPIG